jgi:hypothetical protein
MNSGKIHLKCKEKDYDRLREGDVFFGTYMCYPATPAYVSVPIECDVKISSLTMSRREEVRAYREALKSRGQKPPALRDDTLHRELLVVAGPDMSADEVVVALRRLIDNIKKDGLMTGLDDRDDEYVMEKARARSFTMKLGKEWWYTRKRSSR